MSGNTNKPQRISKAEFQEVVGNEAQCDTVDISFLEDVSVELCVELGRINKKAGEIAGLKIGSVIELDRIAGDNMDVFVNGTYLARGEVVILEDAYGIRITGILSE